MPDATSATRPTISIYQNPDHIAGILQQIYQAPLVVAESREHSSDRSDSERRDQSGTGGLSGSVSIPGLGGLGASVGGQRGRVAETGLAASSRLTQNFEYSQAYYLTLVRNHLREHNILKTVLGTDDADQVKVGDFVEYRATFRPNEINALLDILTPDLIAAITYHHYRTQGIKAFDDWTNFEELKAFSEKNIALAQAQADLARAIAEAVRVDFRSQKTREFYGTIGSGEDTVTAVTICDNPNFVVDDEDRILDGQYTVLGKVTAPTTLDVPILERNKVLDRLKPEGVDELFDTLRGGVSKQARELETRAGGDPLMADIFDTALASRIDGRSFKVVPVAIYA